MDIRDVIELVKQAKPFIQNRDMADHIKVKGPADYVTQVDGTTNLIHDYQHSTVSLGLYEKGEIVMGVIYDPFREEVFYAEKGKGSFRNGEPIHAAQAGTLGET